MAVPVLYHRRGFSYDPFLPDLLKSAFFFSEYIKCVMRVSDHILSFANRKMILEIQFVHSILHSVYGFSHMICVAVSSNGMKLCHIKLISQTVDVLFTVQLKNIPRI